MKTDDKRFTGKHFLVAILGFFGIIIAVNLVMAYQAVTTFSGVTVSDPYERGRNYNQAISAHAAQESLGWSLEFNMSGDSLHAALDIRLTDQSGQPLPGKSVLAEIRRPARHDMDQTIRLNETAAGRYRSVADFPMAGRWLVRILVFEDGQVIFRQDQEIRLKE